MKIICKKKLRLNSYSAILSLEKQTKREDIAKFLEKKIKERDIELSEIEEKIIKNKLIPLNLVDKEYNLTEKGKKVCESKEVWVPEKGEYEIGCLEDSFIAEVISIRPEAPLFLEERNVNFDLVNEKLNQLNKEIDSIKNLEKYKLKDKISYLYPVEKNENINLVWEANMENGKENEEYSFTYKNKGIKERERKGKKGKSIDWIMENSFVNEQNWNKSLKVLMIPYLDVKGNLEESNNFIKNYSYEDFKINNYKFEEVEFKNIKIMPKTKKDAISWNFDNILNMCKEKYLNIEEFKEIVDENTSKKQISFHGVEAISQEEFIRETRKHKNKNVHFNVSSSFDLLGIEKINSVQVNTGDQISIKEIVSELLGEKRGEIEELIWTDNYLLAAGKRHENKKLLRKKVKFLKLILGEFKSRRNTIITSEKDIRNFNKENLSKDFKNCSFKSNEELLDKHPRSLEIKFKDGKTKIWRIDRSIDFIDYEQEDFSVETRGKARSIAFNLENQKINKYKDDLGMVKNNG